MKYLTLLIFLTGCINETEIAQVAKIVSETPITVRIEQVPLPDSHSMLIGGEWVQSWVKRDSNDTYYLTHRHLNTSPIPDDSDEPVETYTRAEQLSLIIQLLNLKYPNMEPALFLSYYADRYDYLEVILLHWMEDVTGGYSQGDLDRDGRTDCKDFGILSENWLKEERPW